MQRKKLRKVDVSKLSYRKSIQNLDIDIPPLLTNSKDKK